MQRIIMHIDMNSYFASCEQQDNKEWRDKPLGVCEHLGGIIIAPSVEARRWGIKTGTPVWEARKLCPGIILTKTNPDRYRYYTAKFLKVFEDYTSDIERYSIDEAFLDLTRVTNVKSHHANKAESIRHDDFRDVERTMTQPYGEAYKIGMEIKRRIRLEVGDYLRCSVGVAWSKFMAKIASDMQKPDGLTMLRRSDKPMLYQKLSLTDMPGIGARQAKRLRGYGIRTVLDLKNCPVGYLRSWFGIMGYHLWSMGQLEGSWHESFTDEAPVKSVGHMYSIAQEFRERKEVGEQVLYKLSEMVARRLRALGMGATALSAYVADKEYNFFGGQARLGSPTASGRDIFVAGRHAILKPLKGEWPLSIYRISVTALGLEDRKNVQLSLFPSVSKRLSLDRAVDKLNHKYGKGEWEEARERAALGRTPSNRTGEVILPAPAFFAQDVIRDSTGFGRMREFSVSDFKRGG